MDLANSWRVLLFLSFFILHYHPAIPTSPLFYKLFFPLVPLIFLEDHRYNYDRQLLLHKTTNSTLHALQDHACSRIHLCFAKYKYNKYTNNSIVIIIIIIIIFTIIIIIVVVI